MSTFTPRPYQQAMREHILDVPRGALFAGMGMGKTSTTLNAIHTLQVLEPEPVLVLAPLRVAQSTWPDEAAKWDHLRDLPVVPVVGTLAQRVDALHRDAAVYTTNYEQVPWLVDHFGDRWPFATVIADESTRLKSFRLTQGGKRTQALAKIAHPKVRRWVNLTGTPAPNGLQDLWGQTWFLDKGQRLGRSFTAFEQRWFSVGRDGYTIQPHAHSQAEIQALLADICMSLRAEDWFDLREPIVTDVFVDMPARARRLYDSMEKKMFAELAEDREIEAVSAAARTMKCLQLANGAAYLDETGATWEETHDAKLQALESIVNEAAGAPVLVAYHFKSDLARLLKAFPRARHLDSDPQTIRDWNAGRIPLLLAHPASAGHGLNLQDGGHHLVFFAHWWDLEQRLQIIERLGPTRQAQAGHDRPLYLYNILARDTVDELVLARVESKRAVQDILMDAMKRRGIR